MRNVGSNVADSEMSTLRSVTYFISDTYSGKGDELMGEISESMNTSTINSKSVSTLLSSANRDRDALVGLWELDMGTESDSQQCAIQGGGSYSKQQHAAAPDGCDRITWTQCRSQCCLLCFITSCLYCRYYRVMSLRSMSTMSTCSDSSSQTTFVRKWLDGLTCTQKYQNQSAKARFHNV